MILQAMTDTKSFWEFNIGHLIDTGLLFVGFGGYMISRKSDIREAQGKREKEAQETMRMHTENRERLDVLMTFHQNQERINSMRDEQVSSLKEQTSALKHIAEGFDRRLELLESQRGRHA
jgi:hypothetical protein